MLFLCNLKVVKLGDPLSHIRADAFPMSLKQVGGLKVRAVLDLVRASAFENPEYFDDPKGRVFGLLSMIAYRMDANAALILKPAKARRAEDVIIRLADVPITTMAHLWQLQTRGPLSPHSIDRAVWAHAA